MIVALGRASVGYARLTSVEEDTISFTRQQKSTGVDEMIVAGQQNVRGPVCSMDLEMELAETDEVVVRQNDPFSILSLASLKSSKPWNWRFLIKPNYSYEGANFVLMGWKQQRF